MNANAAESDRKLAFGVQRSPIRRTIAALQTAALLSALGGCASTAGDSGTTRQADTGSRITNSLVINCLNPTLQERRGLLITAFPQTEPTGYARTITVKANQSHQGLLDASRKPVADLSTNNFSDQVTLAGPNVVRTEATLQVQVRDGTILFSCPQDPVKNQREIIRRFHGKDVRLTLVFVSKTGSILKS